MNSHTDHGLFLVTDSAFPVINSEALANDIVARLERELALANPNRAHVSYLPESFFQPQRDTPIAVLRRVVKNLYSFTFSA